MTKRQAVGALASNGLADLDVAGADLNADADFTTPLWSETRWHCCWSVVADVGLYIHTGRFRKDLDMWWAHVAVYLPDGLLAVDRFWFRNTSRAGVKSHNLDLTVTESGWHSTFDGVGELASTAALSARPHGSAAPSARVRWEVTASAAAPVWDVYSSTDQTQDFAPASHVQQAATTSGKLWVDGVEFSLGGVGFHDHSSGARDFSAWRGHRFLIAVLPRWVVHAFTIFRDDGRAAEPIGVVMADDVTTPITQFEAPRLSDATGLPLENKLVVTGPDGPITLQANVIHALPISATRENDNYNGVDWNASSDPMVIVEGVVLLTTPDGERGVGFLERSARQSTLPRPTGP